MVLTRRAKRVICVLLSAVILSLTAFSLYPSAASGDYDYSRPASSHNVTLSSADILSQYLGAPLTDGERQYLEKHGGVSISYDAGITTGYLLCEYREGALTLSAREYAYTANNGCEVVWIPSSVTAASVTQSLVYEGSRYVARFDNVAYDESLAVTVDYTLSLSVLEEDISSIINMAFTDAPTVKAELERRSREYEELVALYNQNVVDYEQYLVLLAEYESQYALYTQYLIEKKLYDDAKKEYDSYVQAYERYQSADLLYKEYEEKLKEYNEAYTRYNDYLTALAAYEVNKVEYKKFLENMELVREKLSVMDALNMPMTMDRTVYSAVLGGTVDSVIDKLASTSPANLKSKLGVDPEVVYAARDITPVVREILTEYFAIEDELERYRYYDANYEKAILPAFTTLFQCLENLYNSRVEGALISQGNSRDVKYRILVAQLYLITAALTDGEVYSYTGEVVDLNRKMKDCKYSFKDILEGVDYLPDTNSAAPLESGCPTVIVEMQEPTPCDKPTMPTEPPKPVKPDEVQDPGEAPAEVDEPVEPTEVKRLDKPEEYIPESELVKLVEDYDSGLLHEREEPSESYTLTATHTVTKRVFNVEEVTLMFYDTDGTLLYITTVDNGTASDYVGPVPTKAEDDSATYTFAGWQTSDGRAVDLSCVTEDMTLTPRFKANVKYYDITFVTPDSKVTYSVAYGDTPVYLGTPVKAEDEYFTYEFSGWDSEISATTGDRTYTAEFSREYIMPLSLGGARLTYGEDYLVAECYSIIGSPLDISGVISRALSSRLGLSLVSRSYTLNLSYNALLEMQSRSDTHIALKISKSGAHSAKYTVTVLDSSGAQSEGKYTATVITLTGAPAAEGLRLYTLGADGAKISKIFNSTDTSVSFSAECGVEYILAEEYRINTVAPTLGSFFTALDEARPGDVVELKLDIPTGVSLDRLYLLYPDGTEVDIVGGDFVMPQSSVSVVCVTSRIEYTVVFTDGERIIASYRYYYGDTVIPPENPTRATDGQYRYTFVCWSDEISTVTEDKTYVAYFERIPVAKDSLAGGGDGLINRLFIALDIAIYMTVLVIIPASVLNIVICVREKKRYKTAANDKENNA